MRNKKWMDDAACRVGSGVDPWIFHATDPDSQGRAKAICATCPVRKDCLDWALQPINPVPHSTAGGLTVDERAKIRRRRRGAA